MANGRPTLVSFGNIGVRIVSPNEGFKSIADACPDRWNIVSSRRAQATTPRIWRSSKPTACPGRFFASAISRNRCRENKERAAFYGATADGGVFIPLHYLIVASGRVDAIVNGRINFAEPQRLAAFCAV